MEYQNYSPDFKVDENKISLLVDNISDFLNLDPTLVTEKIFKEIKKPGITINELVDEDIKNTPELLGLFLQKADEYIYEISIDDIRQNKKQINKKLVEFVHNHPTITDILDCRGCTGINSIELEEKGHNVTYFSTESRVSEFAKFIIQKNKKEIKIITDKSKLKMYDCILFSKQFLLNQDTKIISKLYSKLNLNGFFIFIEPQNNEFLNRETESRDNKNNLHDIILETDLTKVNKIQISSMNIFIYAKFKPVDIVMPVHNAIDDTKACLDSLIKNWSGGPHKIIIINDGSTDPAIEKILNNFSKIDYIHILKHDKAKGFVATANKGMKFSEHEIILLNSDTIVTKNWFPKLIEVANRDKSIALVTPLSNNASIYSWPIFWNENEITVDEISEVLEKNSLERFPKIPVGVGFCIYIKREIINKIGFLDEKTFGMGYGEENDFCLRAKNIGFDTVLADNTFIFHKGGASFKKTGYRSKNQITNLENEEKLVQKHPEFPELVQKFLETNVLNEIKEHLEFYLSRKKLTKRNKIMFLLHNQVYRNLFGGTEMHVESLIKQLRKTHAVYVVSGNIADRVYVQEFIDKNEFTYIFPIKPTEQIQDKKWKELFDTVLELFHPDIIHIHHFKNSSLDLIQAGKDKEIPVIITIHDYFSICPNYNLINFDSQEFCDIPTDLDICKKCIESKFGYKQFSLSNWRDEIAKTIADCIIIYPSVTARDQINRIYHPTKEIIIPHGIDDGLILESKIKYSSKNQTKEFSIAFIGYLDIQKGSILIKESVPKLLDKKINVHFFGPVSSDFIKKQNKENSKRLFYHGPYQDKKDVIVNLKENKIDLIGIVSPWPETFSYVLSEAWLNGIPVITGPHGAPAERISKTNGGIVLKELNSNEFVNTIVNLSDSPKQHESLINNISKIKIKTDSEMVTEYKKLYESQIINHNHIEDEKFRNIIMLNFLKFSNIISDKENRESQKFTFDIIASGPNNSHRMLSEKTWVILNELYPTSKFGSFAKFTTAAYLYIANLGFITFLKRINNLYKNKKIHKIPKRFKK